jgi:hypothetical protein
MNADDEVRELVQRVEAGDLDQYVAHLDGTDFGLYLPAYVEKNRVKLMLKGYSQIERNLKVNVSKSTDDALIGAKPVAWMGGQIAKDSKCAHGSTAICKHCTAHPQHCRHCTHKTGQFGKDLLAPELDYDDAIKKLDDKKHLLDPLAKDQFGLALLHGHNDQFMFTKLPEGHVSVIENGMTTFRKEEDVLKDSTFVPNVWRAVGGRLRIAGGYSGMSEGDA